MINAADTPFHQGPKSLNRVGVDVAHDIHLRGMIDSVMRITMMLQFVVSRKIIGKDRALWQHVFFDHADQGLFVDVQSSLGNDAALASFPLYDSDNWGFLFIASSGPSSVAFPPSAEIGFVHFYAVALQLQILREQSPDLPKHPPRRLVRDACFPLDLFRGDSAPCRSHQIHGIEPQPKRSAGLLEDRPGHWRDHASAIVASVGRATRNAVMLPLLTALLAMRHAAREPLFFQELKASVIVWELVIKVIDRVPQMLRDCLSGVHENSMSNLLLDVKG